MVVCTPAPESALKALHLTGMFCSASGNYLSIAAIQVIVLIVCIKCTAGLLPEDERTPQHLQLRSQLSSGSGEREGNDLTV